MLFSFQLILLKYNISVHLFARSRGVLVAFTLEYIFEMIWKRLLLHVWEKKSGMIFHLLSTALILSICAILFMLIWNKIFKTVYPSFLEHLLHNPSPTAVTTSLLGTFQFVTTQIVDTRVLCGILPTNEKYSIFTTFTVSMLLLCMKPTEYSHITTVEFRQGNTQIHRSYFVCRINSCISSVHVYKL